MCGTSSRVNFSHEGKSISVLGAVMFAWIIMMPHERWNIRNENAPGLPGCGTAPSD
jgi:hypothetical protein